MSAPVETLSPDGTDAQALPVAMAEARILGLPVSVWPRILAPLVIGVIVLALWERERFTAVFVTHSVFESVYLSQRIVVMAARPGRIMADLSVDAAYPRDDLFRTSGEYAHLCRVASTKLKEAIG